MQREKPYTSIPQKNIVCHLDLLRLISQYTESEFQWRYQSNSLLTTSSSILHKFLAAAASCRLFIFINCQLKFLNLILNNGFYRVKIFTFDLYSLLFSLNISLWTRSLCAHSNKSDNYTFAKFSEGSGASIFTLTPPLWICSWKWSCRMQYPCSANSPWTSDTAYGHGLCLNRYSCKNVLFPL